MYHKSEQIKKLKMVVKDESIIGDYIAWYEKYLQTNNNGGFDELLKVKYFIPNYKILGNDLKEISMQLYFQKMAMCSNIPFWNSYEQYGNPNILLIQDLQQANKDNTFITLSNNFTDFYAWLEALDRRFLDFKTKHIMYEVSVVKNYLFCTNINFVDTKTLRLNGIDNKLNFLLDNDVEFKLSNIKKPKLIKIGYNENNQNSYIKLIQNG